MAVDLSTWNDPFTETLAELQGARIPLAAIRTTEEARLLRLARACIEAGNRRKLRLVTAKLDALPAEADAPALDLSARRLYYWNQARGLVLMPPSVVDGALIQQPQPIEEIEVDGEQGPSTNPVALFAFIRQCARQAHAATFFLADFGQLLEQSQGNLNHELIRRVKDLGMDLRAQPVTVLFVGPSWPAIPSLKDDVKVEDLPLPDQAGLRWRLEVLLRAAARNPDLTVALADEDKDDLLQALRGLTEQECDRVLNLAARRHGGLTAACIPTVISEKRDLIKAVGALEFLTPRDLGTAGGYRAVLRMLERARLSWHPRWSRAGLRMKGAIFTGISGAGKSYWASIAPSVMKLPAIRLSMGAVMGSLVGESENNLRLALKRAEAVGGILVIDEFEKAIAGMESSGASDGGTTSRVAQGLLTWMAEQEECYVLATANDLTGILQKNPELVRGGRFDAVMFFDLPTEPELVEIFTVHLQRRGADPAALDVPACASAAKRKGFVAAEVEVVTKEGLLTAAMRAEETGAPFAPLTADLLEQIGRYTPLAAIAADVVSRQRDTAKKFNFQSASDPAPAAAALPPAPAPLGLADLGDELGALEA